MSIEILRFLSFWTSYCPLSTLTSNPPRLGFSFGLSTAFSPLQRPIHHTLASLLDFNAPSLYFNVQSTTISCSFWTSAMPPAASTSNPSRFLAPFGLLPAFPPLQRLIRHASNPHLPPHNHKLPTTQKSNTSTSVPALLYIF